MSQRNLFDRRPQPPIAARRPFRVERFGKSVEDPWHWLRDDTRKNADVIDYLRQENEYTDAVMAPLAETVEQLFKEQVARIKEEDSPVPGRRSARRPGTG